MALDPTKVTLQDVQSPKTPAPPAATPQPAIDPRVQQITAVAQNAANNPQPGIDSRVAAASGAAQAVGGAVSEAAKGMVEPGVNHFDGVKQMNAENFAQQQQLATSPAQMAGVVARGAMDDVAAPLVAGAATAKDITDRMADAVSGAWQGVKDFGAGIVGLQPPTQPAPAAAPVATPAARTPPAAQATAAAPAPAPKMPAANVQELITAQNANRTPVSDPYSGPAASPTQTAVTPTIGVAGFQQQLANIRALSDSTPAGGFNALTDHTALENAEKTSRWGVQEVIDKLSKSNSRSGREAIAGIVKQQLAGDSAANTANINQQGRLTELGMQLPVTMRGQNLQAQTAAANRDAAIYGHDTAAATARAGQAVTARGQDKQAEASKYGVDVRADSEAAGLASAERRAQLSAAATKYTADMHAAAAAEAAKSKGVQLNDGSVYMPATNSVLRMGGTVGGKPVAMGMYPVNSFLPPPQKDKAQP